MIQDLQSTFGSVLKCIEVFALIKGVKPSLRIMVGKDSQKKYTDFFEERGYSVGYSDFKVIKQDKDTTYYSDHSVKVPLTDEREGHRMMYVATSKDTVAKLKKAEADNNHLLMGELLGYPACCCQFFEEHFVPGQTDITLDVLDHSDNGPYPFVNNIAARHFDLGVLSHFPCSFSCEPSQAIGQRVLNAITDDQPQLAELLTNFLKGGVIYTDMLGVFLLKECSQKDSVLTFNQVLTTSQNRLFKLLEESKQLKIESKNKLLIAGQEVGGPGVGFAYFE